MLVTFHQESWVKLRPVPTRAAYNWLTRIDGQILNMFNTDSLRRVGRRLWRVGRRLHKAYTHTPIIEQLALEPVLESADYSSELADSIINLPKMVCGYGP